MMISFSEPVKNPETVNIRQHNKRLRVSLSEILVPFQRCLFYLSCAVYILWRLLIKLTILELYTMLNELDQTTLFSTPAILKNIGRKNKKNSPKIERSESLSPSSGSFGATPRHRKPSSSTVDYVYTHTHTHKREPSRDSNGKGWRRHQVDSLR